MGIFSSKKRSPTTHSSPNKLTATGPYGQRPAWLYEGARATVYEGRENLDVVGESHYQDSLWMIAKSLANIDRGDRARVPAVAILVAEDGNPYDKDAVAVWVSGLQVGHISRDLAPDLRTAVLRLQRETGQLIGIKATIVGGGPGKPSLGVFLNIDPADFGLEHWYEDEDDGSG